MAKIKIKKYEIYIILVICTLVSVVMSLIISTVLNNIFTEVDTSNVEYTIKYCIDSLKNNKNQWRLFYSVEMLLLLLGTLIYVRSIKTYITPTVEVTDRIKTTATAGQGQYGTSRWMTDEETNEAFQTTTVENNKQINDLIDIGKKELKEAKKTQSTNLQKRNTNSSGVVVNHEKKNGKEEINAIHEDTHTMIVGATRSGKTRGLVLPTIGVLGLAGESMIISDPKGELYTYTHKYLIELGYKVQVLDFNEPSKSNSYNILQPVIEKAKLNDMDGIANEALSIANAFVPEGSSSEPIWENGEKAIITAGIIAVVWDNRDKPQYQNMYNVFTFLVKMCKKLGNVTALDLYLNDLASRDLFHPALLDFEITGVGSEKAKESFIISALTKLKLYATFSMHQITKKSDFTIEEIGSEKVALFLFYQTKIQNFTLLQVLLLTSYIEGL